MLTAVDMDGAVRQIPTVAEIVSQHLVPVKVRLLQHRFPGVDAVAVASVDKHARGAHTEIVAASTHTVVAATRTAPLAVIPSLDLACRLSERAVRSLSLPQQSRAQGRQHRWLPRH
jgi:hypothetical protein